MIWLATTKNCTIKHVIIQISSNVACAVYACTLRIYNNKIIFSCNLNNECALLLSLMPRRRVAEDKKCHKIRCHSAGLRVLAGAECILFCIYLMRYSH